MRGTDLYPHAASWVVTLGLALAASVCVLASGGCVPAAALEQARTQYEVNEAYVEKELQDELAVGIAADNADAWAAQLQSLDGTPLPAPVVERLKARGDLPE